MWRVNDDTLSPRGKSSVLQCLLVCLAVSGSPSQSPGAVIGPQYASIHSNPRPRLIADGCSQATSNVKLRLRGGRSAVPVTNAFEELDRSSRFEDSEEDPCAASSATSIHHRERPDHCSDRSSQDDVAENVQAEESSQGGESPAGSAHDSVDGKDHGKDDGITFVPPAEAVPVKVNIFTPSQSPSEAGALNVPSPRCALCRNCFAGGESCWHRLRIWPPRSASMSSHPGATRQRRSTTQAASPQQKGGRRS